LFDFQIEIVAPIGAHNLDNQLWRMNDIGRFRDVVLRPVNAGRVTKSGLRLRSRYAAAPSSQRMAKVGTNVGKR
jgi:hypothetical protein